MTEPIYPPGSTIGILGGGQLGRMLSMAAAQLGLRSHVYCAKADSPAFDVCARQFVGAFDDWERLAAFAQSVDVATFEFENIPAQTVAYVGKICPVYPTLSALEVAQDRLAEKRFAEKYGIDVAPYTAIDSLADLETALSEKTGPTLLKTRRMGYDGKGQYRITSAQQAAKAFTSIGEAPSILEDVVSFDCEISVICVRNAGGEIAHYDVAENTHGRQILRQSRVPARVPEVVAQQAQEIADKIAIALDYVGVLAVELFYLGPEENACEGRLLLNEMAPRVHNSGHWTLDACEVSQFENHIRAIAGWPLGPTQRHADAIMTNLIGDEVNDWAKLAAAPDTVLHLYGKKTVQPGRKMGHVTRLFQRNDDASQATEHNNAPLDSDAQV